MRVKRRALLGCAVAVVLVVGCAADDHCPGGRVEDPGAAVPPDVFGPVEHPASEEGIDVGGVTVPIGARTTSNRRCTFVDTSESCYAFVRRGDDGAATAVWYFSDDQARPDDELAISTNAYSIQDTTVVLSEGLELTLDENFSVQGCDPADREGLARARFGATFYVDATTGRVNRAGCNGCM